MAVFTITNRGTSALPARGWAIYYTALHDANDGSATGALRLENVTGSLQRIVPGPEFGGLAPGQSAEVEYRTSLLTNNSFAPNGVYAVFDDAPSQPRPVTYTAVPFERAPQPGPDPHVITPEAQFELDTAVHEVPVESLPPVFPTPVSVERREGTAHARRAARGRRGSRAAGRSRACRRVPEAAVRGGEGEGRVGVSVGGRARAPSRGRQGRGTGLARGLRAGRRPEGGRADRRELAGRRLLRAAVAARAAAGRGRAAPAGRRRPPRRSPFRRCASSTPRASATAASCSTWPATSSRRRRSSAFST